MHKKAKNKRDNINNSKQFKRCTNKIRSLGQQKKNNKKRIQQIQT